MNILFYTPLNSRCLDIESQAIEFSKRGHRIFLLTQNESGLNHQMFESHGFNVYDTSSEIFSGRLRTVSRLVRLIRFCWKYKIDLIYSHLEPANFIAVIAQYFIKSRVIICRHHVDAAKLYSFENDFSYRLTYKLAKDIIVVSKRAKDFMVHHEKVNSNRIHVIPLSYNFDLYEPISQENVEVILKKYPTDILLLSVFRLTKYKRPFLSINLVKELIRDGIKVKLVILGQGELASKLKEQVVSEGLGNSIYFEGYVNNVQEYMTAADVLVHPSVLDSSSIVLKESGIVNLPMIACHDVGDFDEVIENGVNGFLVDRDNFVMQAKSIIKQYISDKASLRNIGKASEVNVRNRFSILDAKDYYQRCFHN